MNYLLSCTANFGVVPLFLFSAFLFFPALFTLFLRIIRVFLVLEPMLLTSSSKDRPIYLSFMNRYVKILLILTSILLPSSDLVAAESIFLAKGEQQSIKLLKLGQFSIGNKDILSHKYIESKGQFLIKGKAVGFSDLILWEKGKKQVYHIYVLDKRSQLKNQQLEEILSSQKIPHELKGNLFITKGEINELGQYLLLKKLEQKFKNSLFVQSYFSNKLRNELIAKAYEQIMGIGFYDISCEDEMLTINCLLNSGDKNLKPKIKFLTDNYFIQFIHTDIKDNHRNLKVKLKFVQFERLDGEEFSFGAHKINASLGDLFDKGLRALIENNILSLSENSINVSTLAEPEITMQLEQEATIRVGSEIPYQGVNNSNQVSIISQTLWKFAGLRVKVKMTKLKEGYSLTYTNELTSPDAQNIQGSKESATLLVPLNKPTTLFKIAFRSQAESKAGIPFLNEIPLLGRIFRSSNRTDNFKHIYGYIKVVTDE